VRNPFHSTLGQTIALQYLTLGLGLAWWWVAKKAAFMPPVLIFGRRVYFDYVLTMWFPPAAVAIVLLTVATIRVATGRPTEDRTLAIEMGLLTYACLVLWREPFMWVVGGDPTNGLIAVAYIVPPFLGFRHLVEKRERLAVAALVLFLATCIASAFCNASRATGVARGSSGGGSCAGSPIVGVKHGRSRGFSRSVESTRMRFDVLIRYETPETP